MSIRVSDSWEETREDSPPWRVSGTVQPQFKVKPDFSEGPSATLAPGARGASPYSPTLGVHIDFLPFPPVTPALVTLSLSPLFSPLSFKGLMTVGSDLVTIPLLYAMVANSLLQSFTAWEKKTVKCLCF